MLLQLYLFLGVLSGVLFVTYGDMIMASRYTLPFFKSLPVPFLLNLIGVFIILICYYYGYRAFHDVWKVSIFYVCITALVQPVVIYFVLNNLPTYKQIFGFLFGIVGIILTL